MQPHMFAYEELTPLEQCIEDFMARQGAARKPRKTSARGEQKRLMPKMPRTGE